MASWLEPIAQASSVDEVVGLAIGAGSVCWEHPEFAGVFQSEQATAIIDTAVTRIRELTS